MTTTKKFRAGALLLALSATAVFSSAVLAAGGTSQAQSWSAGAEGAKDVNWALVKPGEFSFTVTSHDITEVDSQGSANPTTDVGSWTNGSGYVKLTADNQPTGYVHHDELGVFATGNTPGPHGGRELMGVQFVIQGGSSNTILWDIDGKGSAASRIDSGGPITPGASGILKGAIGEWHEGEEYADLVTSMDDVMSTKFVLHLTAKQDQP